MGGYSKRCAVEHGLHVVFHLHDAGGFHAGANGTKEERQTKCSQNCEVAALVGK